MNTPTPSRMRSRPNTNSSSGASAASNTPAAMNAVALSAILFRRRTAA
jgi:hypothetical protein